MGGDQQHSTGREVPSALAWGLIARILIAVLGIASNALIVRALGNYHYGVYSLFLNIARFLSLAIGLGFPPAILQFLPEMRVKGNALGARQLLVRAVLFQFGAWVILLPVVFLLRGWLSELLHADLTGILLLGAALLVFEMVWITLTHVHMALRLMRRLTVVSVAQRVLLIALVLLLVVHLKLRVPGVLYAVAGSLLVGGLLLGRGLPRMMPWAKGDQGPGLPTGRLMKYAVPFVVGSLVNQVLWRSSETLIIGYYWTPREVGYFNAAYNLPQLILEFIPLAIWPIILASLAEVHAQESEKLLRGVRLYFRLLVVLVVPFAISGAVLGGQAYRILYTRSMDPGVPICQCFFLIFLLSFIVNPLRAALYVKERTMANTMITAAGAIVNVAFDFVFIPRYGIWGAVPPVAIALVVTGILQYVVAKRALPDLKLPWGHVLKVLAGSIVVLPLWFIRTRLEDVLLFGVVLTGATLAQYFLLRLMRVFGSEERDILLQSNLPMRRLIADLLAPKDRS
ncbi:MAG: oligosaccharide flippase family protein [Candidatus Eisenbacteria sp.]|nr:oligosaccharide flippase family protein [Candidatus Eisenbacteria bacterium]